MRPAALLALLLLTPSAVFAEAPLNVKGVGATEELACAAARRKLPENAMKPNFYVLIPWADTGKAKKNKSASKESFVCSIDYLLP